MGGFYIILENVEKVKTFFNRKQFTVKCKVFLFIFSFPLTESIYFVLNINVTTTEDL